MRRRSFSNKSTLKFSVLLGCLILFACTDPISPDRENTDKLPKATAGPWEPAAGDEKRVRGEVFLDEIDLVELESDIPKFVLRISGALPTPCHEIRVTESEPDESDLIQIEVYSLIDPDEVCIQVLEPFEVIVPVSSYNKGISQVIVNGQVIGNKKP